MQGLDKLSKTLDEAQRALGEIDGELGQVQFDPHDPGSIDRAISEMERTIDNRLSRYASNPLVASLVEQTKEAFRKGILDKAAEARLKGKEE